MQQEVTIPGVTAISPTAAIRPTSHGGRAKCLQRLIRLGLPVPDTLAMDFATVDAIGRGEIIDTRAILATFGEGTLVSVRPSSGAADWGGPPSMLNIGMNDQLHRNLATSLGQAAADALYARFIQSFAIQVARLNPDPFEGSRDIPAMLEAYEDLSDEPFPQDPAEQLSAVLARARGLGRPPGCFAGRAGHRRMRVLASWFSAWFWAWATESRANRARA